MSNHKYIVRKVCKRPKELTPLYEYSVFSTIEGAGGFIETLTGSGWYVIERTRDHVFAFDGRSEYALFTWRKRVLGGD